MDQSHTVLDGKWVLVTGAGRRIGAAIAQRLHTEGANIVVHYRSSEEPAERLADVLNGARPDSAITSGGDLLATMRLPDMISQIISQTDRLDAVINNASSFYPTPLGTITEEQWDDLMGTNLKAPLFLSQAAAPYLKKNRGHDRQPDRHPRDAAPA